MSDRVLQYVLADLRPLWDFSLLNDFRSFFARIVPKLQAEADAHLGPGGPANAKKGTVDVKRGGRNLLLIVLHPGASLSLDCRLLPVCLFPSKDGTSLSVDQGRRPLPFTY